MSIERTSPGKTLAPKSQVDSHLEMHRDHQLWLSENNAWRVDICNWQEEQRHAETQLAEVEEALQEHKIVLQTHAAAIRARQEQLAGHEHALAACERGQIGPELATLTNSHDEEAAKHSQQREAHERIKRHHHGVIAQVNMLHKVLGKSM